MQTFQLILELIGTVAFAVSGAVTAIEKKMDIFGVCVLALTTAVGGGIIRDLILGNTPPAIFLDPVYALTAVLVALIVFLRPVRSYLMGSHKVYRGTMLVMDSLGLGIFTVVGISIAFSTLENAGAFLTVFVGVITGVGGGVLRDIMAGNTPFIFVKHIYAVASLLGALICVFLWQPFGQIPAMMLGTLLVLLIRLLSSIFHWNLPRAD